MTVLVGASWPLVVVRRVRGADVDAEQLAFAEQLFGAALAELAAVARGQPCLVAGDFKVEPTKIPCHFGWALG